MDKIHAYKYRYKDPTMRGAGPGEYLGIMAQDAEKSKKGKEMVLEDELGKMLDVKKGFSLLLASSANLHKRIKELEK